ncbi:MAG: hypothetical protein ACRENI_01420 [Gemmatimonadaceae bacterium]
MLVRTAAIAALVVFARLAGAQSAAAHVSLGDGASESLNPAVALGHYEAALAAESANYEALWKASREAVDLGEFESDEAKRTALFAKGERLARQAVEANPDGAEGHFSLARALGRTALTLGVRDRVKYATEVRDHALTALRLEPNHAGALHVMGVWNAEVMRLSGFERFFARNLLGGKVFGTANWSDAVSYMERSVAADPDRLTHHLDLARIYADVDEKEKARAEYEFVIRAESTSYNDPHYKTAAAKELSALD